MASLVPGVPPGGLSRGASKGKKERGAANVLDQLQTALCSVLGMQEPQLATLMRVRDHWSSGCLVLSAWDCQLTPLVWLHRWMCVRDKCLTPGMHEKPSARACWLQYGSCGCTTSPSCGTAWLLPKYMEECCA